MIDKLDAYEWTTLFALLIRDGLNYGMRVEGDTNELLKDTGMSKEDELLSSITMIERIFDKYPTFFIDPVLNNIIEDTTPGKEIRVPYPAFFVNRKFAYKDEGYIMGIFVYDVKALTYYMLLDSYNDPVLAKEMCDTIANLPGLDNDLPKISFDFVYIDRNVDGVLRFIVAGEDEILHPIGKVPKDLMDLLKTAMNYSLNVCNLIIHKVDRENPLSPKQDVRIVPHRPYKDTKYETREGQFSIIRAFGNLKNYASEYNKEKRKLEGKVGKNRLKATIVSGHLRTFKHEKYAKSGKQGETIWIMPYLKGAGKELEARLVKLTQ
jgi:hypothetical protein